MLIDVIVETLLAQKQLLASTNHKLVVTGRDPVPVEICHGMTIRREDLRNVHEEADIIVIHQMFVLLFHLYRDGQLTCHVTMKQHPKDGSPLTSNQLFTSTRISLGNNQQPLLCRSATMWLNCGVWEKNKSRESA